MLLLEGSRRLRLCRVGMSPLEAYGSVLDEHVLLCKFEPGRSVGRELTLEASVES